MQTSQIFFELIEFIFLEHFPIYTKSDWEYRVSIHPLLPTLLLISYVSVYLCYTW